MIQQLLAKQATGSESPAHVIVYAGQQSGLSVASWVKFQPVCPYICTYMYNRYIFLLSIYGNAQINTDLAELLALGIRVNHTHTPSWFSLDWENLAGMSGCFPSLLFSGVWVRCPAGKSFGNLFIYVIDATRTKWGSRGSNPASDSQQPESEIRVGAHEFVHGIG